MKYLLVSDTHGYLKNLQTVLERVSPIDGMFHMGDFCGQADRIRAMAGCRVEFVSGNNDWNSSEPREQTIFLAGHRIYMTHGHRAGVHSGLGFLEQTARMEKADIVFYGHTHVPEITWQGGIVFVNPGSLSLPRQAGRNPSFAIMEIDRKRECHFTINYLNPVKGGLSWGSI